ncbi:uncharacterized protein LOC114530958 isoform X1 [Dendronephthya gigantea]|uniref:uncharacterized protein LOC114530958 isoform X1 n=1 Tax=Dendronephthya gigantea TaxID=151771 RepID=UPI00106CFFAA|nr:uncharacterized protein LOC114530958 isoform X1 [Dendronephthya gigantea]
MNLILALFSVYLTRFIAKSHKDTAIYKVQASEGAWSNELNDRLHRHSCKAGRIQKDTTLLHKLKSGTFTELGQVKDLEVCVLQCCESRHCDLALFKDHFCYGITCYSSQHCKTVPAYHDDKMIAVFLTKAKTNVTKQDTKTNQSGGRKANKKPAEFVFYPSESSSDLAFSVNLRNIAQHYINDESVKNILTAKADEYLNEIKNELTGEQDELLDGPGDVERPGKKNAEQGAVGITGIGNKNVSLLENFLLGNHPTQHSRTESSGKRSETFHKLTKKGMTTVTLGAKLLKAAISSSSVAILIVLIVLLAMTRRKRE